MTQPIKLGRLRINQLVADGDGESKMRFNGLKDYIETDNLNMLPLNSDTVSEFIVQYTADIEEEKESEEDE